MTYKYCITEISTYTLLTCRISFINKYPNYYETSNEIRIRYNLTNSIFKQFSNCYNITITVFKLFPKSQILNQLDH